jgi:hypothetical protein
VLLIESQFGHGGERKRRPWRQTGSDDAGHAGIVRSPFQPFSKIERGLSSTEWIAHGCLKSKAERGGRPETVVGKLSQTRVYAASV